ncbi:Thioredoxin-like 4A [Tilletia horrida]|nr:Thioredoxin-like 4A [Tilletia horrida]
MATPSFRIKLRLPPKDDELEGAVVPGSVGEDMSDDDGIPSGSDDGGNEDELDELVDEVEQDAASNLSGTPVRHFSNKKASSSSAKRSRLATDSAPGSPGGDDSPSSKKRILTTREETKDMSLDELDALPAAKRRRAHQARGASGPGRGWRKGLKMGQKPKYEVPPEPQQPVKPEKPEKPDKPEKAEKALKPEKPERTATPKGTPAGKSKAAAAKPAAPPVPAGPRPKPFKYPAITPFRSVPAIKPIARIPQIIPTIPPLDRTGEAAKKAPRRWTKGTREIMGVGGRPIRVPAWFGGPDLGYPLAAERQSAAAAAASAKAGGAAGGGAAAAAAAAAAGGAGDLSLSLAVPEDGRSTPGGGTPAPSTPGGGGVAILGGGGGGGASKSSHFSGDHSAPGSTQKESKAKPRSSLGGAVSRSKGTSKAAAAAAAAATGAGTGGGGPAGFHRAGSASAKSSPLANTIPLPGTTPTQPVGDWRGSSPAFFAGARKTG